ncbi:moricin [Amyelois transitella]|uniref:moricin n=1 Tax=Amyelois transitella TaxID=680683 RepID=UPI00067C6BFF|nr:moricin [Amyelois transitella]
MKLTGLFLMVVAVFALLLSPAEAAPGKIPVKAIKKGGQIIGKALNRISIASTAHDIISQFHHKKKKH